VAPFATKSRNRNSYTRNEPAGKVRPPPERESGKFRGDVQATVNSNGDGIPDWLLNEIGLVPRISLAKDCPPGISRFPTP
jgi:hypothetical protein